MDILILSLSQSRLFDYVRKQTRHFFPDQYRLGGDDVASAFRLALERTEECLNVISYRGYHDSKGNTTFSHLHADQYATFLYFFSNSLWRLSENKPLCDKLLQLNRILFSLFISYKCNLPDHFWLAHPIGSILGNAVYHDFLVVFQGVTINSGDIDAEGRLIPPVLGKGLFLGAHSSIIGNKPVGNYVTIGAGAMVFRQTIPDNSLVICKNGLITVSPVERGCSNAQLCFNVPI